MRIAARTLACAVAALTLGGGILAAPALARTSVQYRLEGKGWGHGIGMSQYGAQGYAQQGWTGEQIIQHYFTGTVVAPRPAGGPKDVRVLLKDGLQTARLQMISPGVVAQGATSMAVVPGDVLLLRVAAGSSSISVTRVRDGVPAQVLTGGGSADPVVTPSDDGGIAILFDTTHPRSGTAFRGTLSGHVSGGKVSVVNTVPFEDYVRAVVPDEMPPSWSAEALKAQAIAARSYALRGLRTGGYFDLYVDTRSQVYGGVGAEEATTDAAVAATKDMVARVGSPAGEVAQTFFFSTSGGRTANNEDVWTAGTPLPYLRSVPSPYEASSSRWTWTGSDLKRYAPAQLGSALGVSGVRSASLSVNASGYAKDLVLRSARGATTVSAGTVQYRLGLLSTWFRLQPLALTTPDVVPAGSFATLTGTIPTSGQTTLQVRAPGQAVRTIKLVKGDAKGSFRTRLQVQDANVTVSLVRSGIPGPSTVVASSTTALGKLRLKAQRKAAAEKRRAAARR